MKKHKMTAVAVFTAALAAAMTFPAFAASVVEVEILQIDGPPDETQLDVEVSEKAPGAQDIRNARTTTDSPASSGRSAQAVPAQPASADTAAAQAPSVQSEAGQNSTAPSSAESNSSDLSVQHVTGEDSSAEQPEGAVSSATVNLSAQQQAVILELIPDDIYRFYTSMLWDQVPETSVDIASISDQDMANEFYGVLRNAGPNSAIFTPVEHEAVEGYSVWFDKDDALAKIAGLYGRGISESAITTYNNEWGGDMPDMIAVDGAAIAPLDPEGEGRINPSITSCAADGDDLIVSLSFTATFEDPKDNGQGLATAVFESYDQSPIGYRLKSIALD